MLGNCSFYSNTTELLHLPPWGKALAISNTSESCWNLDILFFSCCILLGKTKCSKAFQATGFLVGWKNLYTSSAEREKAMYFQGSESCEFDSCLKGMRTKGKPPAPAGSWHCPKTIWAKLNLSLFFFFSVLFCFGALTLLLKILSPYKLK